MSQPAFPRADRRTLADDGDALTFCSTCAFSQACLSQGMDKGALMDLHMLVEHVGPLRPGDHVFREGDPFEAIKSDRAAIEFRGFPPSVREAAIRPSRS